MSIRADSDVRLSNKSELFHKLFNTTVEKSRSESRRNALAEFPELSREGFLCKLQCEPHARCVQTLGIMREGIARAETLQDSTLKRSSMNGKFLL